MDHIKKIGFVIKNSGRRKSSRSAGKKKTVPPAPRAKLLAVSHYHQRPGCHPNPVVFENGEQCFELLTHGRGWVEAGGEWREVTPGDLLWHIPGDCTIGRSDFKNPYSCLAVKFHDGAIRERRVPRITRWEELDEVWHFTREVVQLHADEAFDSNVLLRYIVSRLHFQAELYLRGQRERELPAGLRRAVEMIHRRHAEPLRLRDLADAAGWSVPHLHDKFKEHLGLSPHQALIRRRILAARELLASSNDPIKGVAANCGFPTAAAFCVQFKKVTQLSPASYRKRQLYGSRGK